MKVLVLNAGSSSLRFQLVEFEAVPPEGEVVRFARGLLEHIGGKATCTFTVEGSPPSCESVPIQDHYEAVRWVLARLGTYRPEMLQNLDAVGHRVVHGGDRFTAPMLIDEETLSAIEALDELAPLHNPACISGIRAARDVLGSSIPMVAVFDTAFHQTLPDHAAIYAIPYDLTVRHRIRRYGFHGIAHRYLTLRYAAITLTPSDQINIITLHLGNGCSVSAIRGGKSVDTSMGFTPLEGLIMGTRSGDLDPALIGYLARKEGVPFEEVERWLNERSGLLGISGRSNDMRTLLKYEPVDPRARLAVDLFCYRVRKYIGAYLAVLGETDAIIFSGGIGVHSPVIRARICEGLGWSGLILDSDLNTRAVGVEGRITADRARLHAYVIPVDEEVLIAEDTVRCILERR